MDVTTILNRISSSERQIQKVVNRKHYNSIITMQQEKWRQSGGLYRERAYLFWCKHLLISSSRLLSRLVFLSSIFSAICNFSAVHSWHFFVAWLYAGACPIMFQSIPYSPPWSFIFQTSFAILHFAYSFLLKESLWLPYLSFHGGADNHTYSLQR